MTSAKEGNMEGVLVTAKKDGSNVSFTVISDEKGHYAFPADRLVPGHYNIKIRALGYVVASVALSLAAAATGFALADWMK